MPLPFRILIALGFLALSVILSKRMPLQLFEDNLYDLRASLLAQRQAPSDNIVVVEIDEESIQLLSNDPDTKFSRWPWPRAALAMICLHLREAEVSIFDIILSEADQNDNGPAHDQAFADAMRATSNAVLSVALPQLSLGTTDVSLRREARIPQRFLIDTEDSYTPISDWASLPLESLSHQARRIGHVHRNKANERQYFACAQVKGRGLLPSLALAGLLEATENLPTDADWFHNRSVHLNNHRIKLDDSGAFFLSEYNRPHQAVSAYDVLASCQHDDRAVKPPGYIEPGFFKDKMVLIGGSAEGMADLVGTPAERTPILGVYLHATALDNLLTGRVIHLAPTWLGWILFFLGAFIPISSVLVQPRVMGFVAFFGTLTFFTLAILLAVFARVMVPMIGPLTAFILGCSFFGVLYWFNDWKSRRRLQWLEDAKQRFTDMLVHDLKNNMSSILLSLDMAKTNDKGQTLMEHEEFVEVVDDTSLKMISKINNLLDIRTIQEGRLPIKPESVNLTDFIQDFTDSYRSLVTNAGYRLRLVERCQPNERASFDANLIYRVLENLLLNAVKYGEHGTEIEIEMESKPTGLIFRIRNQGEPISPEVQKHLFEAFVYGGNRPERKQKRIRSTGLGLAFCKLALDAHDGEIQVTSPVEKDQGTGVVVRLPHK